MAATVLIVGNDKSTINSYVGLFGKKEFSVIAATSGRQAISEAKSHRLDAIVVDATSPRLNCKSVCKKLRTESFAPIILIALPNAKIDASLILEAVIAKPLVERKLVARAKTAIENKPPRLLTVGAISLDLEKHKLMRGSKTFELTPKEFLLLKILMSRAGQMVTRKTLMKDVWDTDYLGDTRTLDVHIRWVREKVEDSPSKPERLVTSRGQGYKFVAE